MNKLELTEIVATNLNVTKIDAAKAVDAVLFNIEKAWRKGDKVVLTGFGTFEVKTRAARIGKHPKTGEDIKIPASKSVHFKEGKALKESL